MDTFTPQVISSLVGVLVAWSAVSIWAVSWILNSHRKFTEGKFSELIKLVQKQSQEVLNLERDLMRFKSELPDKYVRREDWIRFSQTMDAKLDTLNERQENTNLRIEKLSGSVDRFVEEAEKEVS